jgi:hypothetical protein
MTPGPKTAGVFFLPQWTGPSLRFTLRQFLLFVLFLSIPLAALAYSRRVDVSSGDLFVICAAVVVPLLLIVLSAVFVSPGAWRNVLCTAFIEIMIVVFFLEINLTVGGWFLLIVLFMRVAPAVMSVARDEYVVGVYVPMTCPNCQQRGFVPGRLLGDTGSGASFYTSLPYRFRWCGHCGARLKSRRLRRKFGPWVDASSSSDDKHYWLWSFADLRRALGREKRSPVADSRDDPAVERVE